MPNPLQEIPRYRHLLTLPPHESLSRLIRMQIEEDGPLPFDRFMEYALYHPQHGFYTDPTSRARAGAHGDFVTAPTLTPLFGKALARFVAACWERLGKPLSWWYVETGAGVGALSRPLVEALKRDHGGAAHGMHVALTDVHPEHLDAARHNLIEVMAKERLHVSDELPALAGPPVVMIANELLDNLPVRVLRRRAGGWVERTVTIRPDGGFDWADAPAPDALQEWVASFQIECPEDHQVEVPVGAKSWLNTVTDALGDAPGVLVLIDYGETARDLLGEPRQHGTLMAYEAHRQDRDILREPGKRDITAHVNWTAVARIAEGLGWDLVGYTKQGSFLAGLGLIEDAARLGADVSTETQFAALQAIKDVMLPGGMGESFKVLVLARNMDRGDAPWPGLVDQRPVDPRPRG